MSQSARKPSIANAPTTVIGSLVLDVGRLIRQDFRRRAQHLNLTQAQWAALMHLSREPGLTQTELADRLEVHPVTVTQLLDRLGKAGWITRKAHISDRRAQCVHLTKASDALIEEMRRLGTQTREIALKGLNAEERKQFENLLLRVKANISTSEPSAGQ